MEMKKKIQMQFTAMVVIIVFLGAMVLTLCFGLSIGKAQANAAIGTGGDAETAPEASPTPEYYVFTDNSDRQNSSFSTGAIVHWQRWGIDSPMPFKTALKNYLDSGEYENINNAHVIVEISEGLPKEYETYVTGDPLLVDYLKTFFYELKENDCMTMFICDTDETRIGGSDSTKDYTEFLDYVDFHVNTDVMTVFAYSIIERIRSDNELTLDYVGAQPAIGQFAVILEKGIGEFFYEEYLLPYIRLKCNISATYTESMLQYYLLIHEINIFLQTDSGVYKNLTTGTEGLSCSDVLDQLSYEVYAIGCNKLVAESNSFVSNINTMRSSYGEEISLFMYLETDYKQSIYQNDDTVYTAGSTLLNFEATLKTMFYDFYFDDIAQYDNWPGRCAVTHKPITFGPDGWMIYPEVLICWCLYLDEDDLSLFG